MCAAESWKSAESAQSRRGRRSGLSEHGVGGRLGRGADLQSEDIESDADGAAVRLEGLARRLLRRLQRRHQRRHQQLRLQKLEAAALTLLALGIEDCARGVVDRLANLAGNTLWPA